MTNPSPNLYALMIRLTAIHNGRLSPLFIRYRHNIIRNPICPHPKNGLQSILPLHLP